MVRDMRKMTAGRNLLPFSTTRMRPIAIVRGGVATVSYAPRSASGGADFIGRKKTSFERLPEFEALFFRDTTGQSL
jgi:hypothetical protein